jgi:hypothetical protein
VVYPCDTIGSHLRRGFHLFRGVEFDRNRGIGEGQLGYVSFLEPEISTPRTLQPSSIASLYVTVESVE